MATLPTPRTTTDVLLAAVHEELVGLRADLALARGGEPADPEPTGKVELQEPAPSKTKSKPARRPVRGT